MSAPKALVNWQMLWLDGSRHTLSAVRDSDRFRCFGTWKLPATLSIVLSFWAILSCQGFAQPNIPPATKTPAANVIRPEYYKACNLFEDGQTSQASLVLEAAFSQSRIVNNQRGIDSVPSLVKMGECYWEQCDIGMALERYDAALQISMMSPRWLSLLKPSNSNTRPEPRNRDVTWAVNARGTQMGVFSDAWPIALGSNDLLLESAAGQGVAGKMVAIDAMEILRSQAIALRRRNQLLGPLARHNPLNDPQKRPLISAFSVNVSSQSDAIQAAMNICRALALLGAGERSGAVQLLTQNLSLTNGLDHPLTAIALLTLVDLAIESNEITVAEERAIEASIVAGRAGQMDHLAEAVEYVSETGFANGHEAAAVKMIQQIVQWSMNKSRLVNIRGHVEFARLSALVGETDAATKHCNAAATILLPKQVVLPRAESVVRYAQAKTAFLEGNIMKGIEKLYEGVAYLRNEKGIGSPMLFQLDLALQLTKSSALSDSVAEAVLGQLLRSPAAGHWRVHPLEQLDWLLVDKTEARNALLDIQLRKKNDSELAAAMDDSIRNRYRKLNELESRVFDLKTIFHGDNRFVANFTESIQTRKHAPLIEQNVAKIQQLVAPLQANPKWDLRKWSEDDLRRWESVTRLSAFQESLLWAAAISPLPVAETFPPRHSQEFLAKSLRPEDAVIMFVAQGNSLRGFLFLSGKWRSWEVADAQSLERQTGNLLGELLVMKNRDGTQNEVKKNWSPSRRIEIRNQLFPKEVWAILMAAGRWIVVPDASLWYLPLESLPLSDQPNSLPCITEHNITYSPTLGLVPFLLDAKPKSKSVHEIDVHISDFLAPDGPRAKDLRDELTGKKRFVVDLSSKPMTSPPSQFFKISSDCINTFAPMEWESIAPVSTDQNPIQSNIGSWNRLPWGAPSSMLLAGVNAIPPPPQATGDEWLRLTLPLIAQGTSHITVSRWPVGGESTATLIRSFQENQEDLSVSESWQRSVLTLWEEQFEQRNEPIFKGAPFSSPENTVSGSHPLLWSGYIRIGDGPSPRRKNNDK
ncbi:MAG TPA: CHAT domain-containing protein [Pirellula sp.]|nr:CHAT domain-containing protein [Pirellula sp.]